MSVALLCQLLRETLLKAEVVKAQNGDVLWQINLEERHQMNQLCEQWVVRDRFSPQMVLPSTQEQIAWGGRRQWSDPSVHGAASEGVTASLGLQQVTTFQLMWGKRLQERFYIMVNVRESEVDPNDKALLSSFLSGGDPSRFSISVLPAGVWGKGVVRDLDWVHSWVYDAHRSWTKCRTKQVLCYGEWNGKSTAQQRLIRKKL